MNSFLAKVRQRGLKLYVVTLFIRNDWGNLVVVKEYDALYKSTLACLAGAERWNYDFIEIKRRR
jgi:hypothetical protein